VSRQESEASSGVNGTTRRGLPKPGQPDSGESGHNNCPPTFPIVFFGTAPKARHSTAAAPKIDRWVAQVKPTGTEQARRRRRASEQNSGGPARFDREPDCRPTAPLSRSHPEAANLSGFVVYDLVSLRTAKPTADQNPRSNRESADDQHEEYARRPDRVGSAVEQASGIGSTGKTLDLLGGSKKKPDRLNGQEPGADRPVASRTTQTEPNCAASPAKQENQSQDGVQAIRCRRRVQMPTQTFQQ